ncbi:hypothetical protein PG1C_07790 [Rugosibacter aromaticivorans]|uniref:Uncharacterized protein n=1 Tax=Rugosibacter aromaticivorans TaxID=1565605 RepID=A0A0C5IZZ3_9PROT|nr:hypothetical protein PG1C_07790 [Rugosibacter aromaticivorans]
MVYQGLIQSGKTFVHEFVARQPGTFMYHPQGTVAYEVAGCYLSPYALHLAADNPCRARKRRRLILRFRCVNLRLKVGIAGIMSNG